MLRIDGSMGEGGGQILRSSLALSMITGKAFRIENIRAKRKRPGLMRQHLTCVLAAAEVCGATVDGASLRSPELHFSPGRVKPGQYQFSVGSAGSTSLVLQTVLPALALADRPSTVELSGGTHNPMSPPFDFLVRVLFPLLKRMDAPVRGQLLRHGFYPAGGGKVRYSIAGSSKLEPLALCERGDVQNITVRSLLAVLEDSIGRREVATALKMLGQERTQGKLVRIDDPVGPGNALLIEVESEHVTELFTGFGERGVPAEKVAGQCARQAERYIASDLPVGEYLADQLLLWIALAEGGEFRTGSPSEHTKTHALVIRQFLDVECRFKKEKPGVWLISV